jgi:nucleoside-diphosphate-sugar epimerase
MNIFVTGGGGYVGSSLVPKLLDEGHKVTVYDLMIYGDDVLNTHQNLKVVKGDLRDFDLLEKSIPNHDALIHLACISNDPSFELNPNLGKSINLDSFEPLVKIAEDSGIKRFLNASSSSVYGVKDSDNVHEEMSLEPLTDYSKYKAQCEDILLKYNSNNFITSTIRPATVCGYSKRQRLDVVVNIFTNIAFHKKKITVFGGDQLRPNIHIEDMVDAYLAMLYASDEKISGKVFNAGDENKTVLELAQIVKEVIGPMLS